jgi:hypothetical protein
MTIGIAASANRQILNVRIFASFLSFCAEFEFRAQSEMREGATAEFAAQTGLSIEIMAVHSCKIVSWVVWPVGA